MTYNIIGGLMLAIPGAGLAFYGLASGERLLKDSIWPLAGVGCLVAAGALLAQ